MLVHLLTSARFEDATIACGSLTAIAGSVVLARVTCPACKGLARPRSQPGLTEKQWLARVRQAAREAQWLTYHPLVSKGSEGGYPDVTLVKPPWLVFAELKTVNGRVTPAQQIWLTALNEVTHVRSYLWTPEDWPQVLQVLQAPGEGSPR